MFLFEKILIGAYCNSLYDLGQRHGPFHAVAELKQNTPGKNLNVTVTNKEICLVRIVFVYVYGAVLFCSLGY